MRCRRRRESRIFVEVARMCYSTLPHRLFSRICPYDYHLAVTSARTNSTMQTLPHAFILFTLNWALWCSMWQKRFRVSSSLARVTKTAVFHIIVHQLSANWGHWQSAHVTRLRSFICAISSCSSGEGEWVAVYQWSHSRVNPGLTQRNISIAYTGRPIV